MDSVDYLIVGAGFAGSVCAEQLAGAGKTVLLVDQRSHIGGNAYDYYDDAGILVHKYGPHIFHTNDRRIVEYLGQFTDWRPYEHRVLSSVDGQLLPVPINLTTLEAFDGDEAAARAAMVEPYTRKQWGAAAPDLLPAVQARIRTRTNRDDRYFTDTFQVMPACGYTRLFERMLANPHIRILLKTSYREVCDLLTDGGRHLPRRPTVIYTGPIDEFFDYELGHLPYRSAVFRFETYGAREFQRVGVINYPAENDGFTRIAEFKHLTGQEHRKTTVAFEYPMATGEPYWPVPTAASAALYARYEALAASRSSSPRVYFAGRLGTYRYYDMHQVVAQALTLAATLITGEPHGEA